MKESIESYMERCKKEIRVDAKRQVKKITDGAICEAVSYCLDKYDPYKISKATFGYRVCEKLGFDMREGL